MMIAKAVSKYNRISPKKARLVTRPLQGMSVAQAYSVLNTVNKRAARFIYTVLKSAFDNARKKDPAVKETGLYISKIVADSGPVLKRFRAASMGRAAQIRKRTSHFTIHLDSKELPAKNETREKIAVKGRAIFKKKADQSKRKDTGSSGLRNKAAAGKRKQ